MSINREISLNNFNNPTTFQFSGNKRSRFSQSLEMRFGNWNKCVCIAFVTFGNVRRKTLRSPWQPLHWLMGYQQLKQTGWKIWPNDHP
ncbi:hypothetical protein CEXT_84091 [Caerostris extrusa]|uniref:Uncharacterized protein n=1 Tax=Caerostris extrusa TaxID=172846 RepID=A0AAV4NL93_CAEEX|nr:hypothetical protein CEXT_84091 [Caerostris extrusa]